MALVIIPQSETKIIERLGRYHATLKPGINLIIPFIDRAKNIVVLKYGRYVYSNNIDLRGQVLAMLGNYEMPCWYNNEYIVAQNAKDDGHQFTSSQIMLLKADGTWHAELTKPSSMAMQPTSGGGRIVYTTIDGLLYEMKINIYQ